MIQLVETLEIAAPIERCFDLARSIDAHVASAGPLDGRAEGGKRTGLSELGDETTWSARFFGIRFRVRTRILSMERPFAFHEQIVSGLPKRFEHRYSFEDLDGARTRMTDRFTVQSRFWPLGPLVDRLYLGPKMAGALRSRCVFLKRLAESEEWRQYVPSAGR